MRRYSLRKVVLVGFLATATTLGGVAAQASDPHDNNDEASCSSGSGASGIAVNLNLCDNALAILGLASVGSPDHNGDDNGHDNGDVHSDGIDEDCQEYEDCQPPEEEEEEEEEAPGGCSSHSGYSGIALNLNLCGNALSILGLAHSSGSGSCSSGSHASGISANPNVCGNAVAIAGLAHSSGTASCSSWSGFSGIAANPNVCGNALAIAGLAAATP